MRIHESGQMYLETIYVLSKEKSLVRAIDVGEHMGYSKPSVSRAMGLLRKNGLIAVNGEGYISLTDEGRSLSSKILERHRVLFLFLLQIGVSEEIATKDACKMEHVISDETFEKMKEYLSKSL